MLISINNMSKVCLSFVFNHQFEKNIPKLRKIYRKRFSTLRFLSPFSTYSEDKDVITVYETSVHFQGYFAQAYNQLPKDCDYYIFCGDDLLLNPALNEGNIISELNCPNASYIKYLNPIWDHSFAWHKFEECTNFPTEDCVVPYFQYLPSRTDLLKLYSKSGIEYKNIGLQNFFGINPRVVTWQRIKAGFRYLILNRLKRYIHLPLIEGYADFIVVPQKSLISFCHYCGIFAAMNLWVDAAVATAMILSSDKIRTEKDHPYTGTEIWDSATIEKRLSKASKHIDRINDLFEKDEFYIHPVKLSYFS